MPLDERLSILRELHGLLVERAELVSEVISTEMGSPISWGLMAQAHASFMTLDYYIDMASDYPFEEYRDGVVGPVVVRSEPVGVVAAVVPWNVPQFVTFSKFAPAMVSGSTMVLKPAPETPLDAYLLAEAAEEAGLPDGVLNVVPAGRDAGAHLVGHGSIDKVAFTGSVEAGKKIMAACARNLTRVSLELGGKSASIILPDADLDEAVPGFLPNMFMNNGQACVAQSRVLVREDQYDEAVERIADRVEDMQVGDPLDPETEVGPLVAERQRERVEGYIDLGREEGAKVAVGGGRPGGRDRGWYVEPTVFRDVDNSMRVAREEIFGPVLVAIPYEDEEDAVRIANDSPYGLSGSVWSGDPGHGMQVARRIRTGNYAINGFGMDFAAPFGGFKKSGIGREFGPEGLETYLEKKTIHLPEGYAPDAADG